MNDQDLLKAINETIFKLEDKINIINNISDNGNEKIAKIKRKTVEVLKNVLNMISSTDQNNTDADEIRLGLETIDTKSNQLFDNALNNINQLKKEESLNNHFDNETINNFSKVVDKTNIEIQDMSSTPEDEVSRQAIEILKNWLLPEGD